MASLSAPSVHGVTGDDKVTYQHIEDDTNDIAVIWLPGGMGVFFDGEGHKATDHMLGFLDQMHAIRNAVLQDKADRAEVAR